MREIYFRDLLPLLQRLLEGLSVRNINLGVAARRGPVDRRNDPVDVAVNGGPPGIAKYYNRDSTDLSFC
jgi:hypothetical protein